MKSERRPDRKNLSFVLASLLVGIVIGASFVYAQSGNQIFTISQGSYPGAPSYTIWVDAGNYYAKNSYGVVVYSGTDADVIINQCITGASEGDDILLRAGEYDEIDAAIVMKSYITLRGEGKQTILKGKASATIATGIIYALVQTHFTVKSFYIDGGEMNSATGISIIGGVGNTVEDIIIADMPTRGFYLSGSGTTLYANRLYIGGSGTYGLEIANNFDGYQFNDCVFEGSGYCNVFITNEAHGVFTNCWYEEPGATWQNIYLSGACGPTFINPVINLGLHVATGDHQVLIMNSNRTTIINPYFYASREGGYKDILLYGSSPGSYNNTIIGGHYDHGINDGGYGTQLINAG